MGRDKQKTMNNQNLKDKAYDLIKSKIANCEFEPGQFLIESDLMLEVGSSRTPVREALNKLEQEKLVKIMPKKGIYVNDITLGLVNEIFEARILIEPYIIQNYGKTIPKTLLKRQSELLSLPETSNDRYEVYSQDQDLHQLIINASCNEYLITLMGQIYVQNHRLRVITGQKIESRLNETREEHVGICNCLIKDEIEGAAELMRIHLVNSKSASVNVMLNNNSIREHRNGY